MRKKTTFPGWIRIKLGEYLEELSERHNASSNSDIPVLSVTNRPGFVVSEEFFDKKVFSKDLSNYKVVHKEQFAYNPSRVNVGSIARLKELNKGLLSPMYVVFKAKEGLDGSYLDYWISSQRFRNLVKASTQGSVRDSLNFSALAEFPFALPSKIEQKEIISILACVDSVIDKTQAIIDQTQTLKKGLMQELFTSGVSGRHKKFKKTEIGLIPEGWEVANLENISKNGINNGIFKKRHQFGRGALLVNVLDTYKSLCVDPSTLDRVEATKEEIKRYALDKGDLLFVRSSLKYEGVGQCCMILDKPETMLYECHLMRVRSDQKIAFPLFVAYYCNSGLFKKSLFSNAKIQTMTTLGQKDIGSIRIPLPKMDEQREIAELLASGEKHIEKNKLAMAFLNDLKSALMQVLLSGEVRVKI